MQFKNTKRSKLLNPDQTEVVYEQMLKDVATGFKIVADAAGVYFEGRSLTFETPVDFSELAKAIGNAGKDHLALKKAVREKLM